MKNRFSKIKDDALRKDLQEILGEMESRELKELDEENYQTVTLTDSLAEYEEQAEKFTPYKWPILSLQERLDGYWPGEMYTLGGGTGIGKSLFAAFLALRFALDGGYVLYFSTEMPHREITRRLINMWQSYTVKDKDTFRSLPISFGDDKSTLSPDLVEIILENNRKLVADGFEKKIELLVVDNLHWFIRGGDSVSEDIGVVTKRLKGLAIKYQVSVLLVSHVNRESIKFDPDRPPPISALKGSSYIEQDSDAVMMINRLKDDSGRSTNKSIINLGKNRRNGRTVDNIVIVTDRNLNFIEQTTWSPKDLPTKKS